LILPENSINFEDAPGRWLLFLFFVLVPGCASGRGWGSIHMIIIEIFRLCINAQGTLLLDLVLLAILVAKQGLLRCATITLVYIVAIGSDFFPFSHLSTPY